MFFFSIKYRYSDILLKKQQLHLSRLFCCNHTCYCVYIVSVTSAPRYITPASRYHPRYQSRSSMYIRGLIPRIFAELAEVVPINAGPEAFHLYSKIKFQFRFLLLVSFGRTTLHISSV